MISALLPAAAMSSPHRWRPGPSARPALQNPGFREMTNGAARKRHRAAFIFGVLTGPQVPFSVLLGEHAEIGLSFLEDAREGWARLQPLEINSQMRMALSERLDLVAVEQRRSGGAIGQREALAHHP